MGSMVPCRAGRTGIGGPKPPDIVSILFSLSLFDTTRSLDSCHRPSPRKESRIRQGADMATLAKNPQPFAGRSRQ
jgi:hypothetical protein